jgi:hypothetical protein
MKCSTDRKYFLEGLDVIVEIIQPLVIVVYGTANDLKKSFGVSREKIPSFLRIIQSCSFFIKNVTRKGKNGFKRIYKYRVKYLIISAVGTNGFIVSAYTINKEDL